jgi:quercetin dioxygenase-like cupin family protein
VRRGVPGAAGLTAVLLAAAPGAAADVQERLALDNACVRVTLLTYPSGADSGLHLNPEPELAIVVEGTLTLVTSAGKRPYGPGQVAYLPTGTVHTALNETGRPVRFSALNLRRCAP